MEITAAAEPARIVARVYLRLLSAVNFDVRQNPHSHERMWRTHTHTHILTTGACLFRCEQGAYRCRPIDGQAKWIVRCACACFVNNVYNVLI